MSFGGTQGAIRYVLTVDDTQATGKINNFKNALRGMDTSVNSSATGLGKINTAMTGMDARTSKLGMVMTGLKQNFGAITTSVGAAMSSVVNLNRAWQDLGDTQIAVDRTALKVSRTQEAVTKAQDKLNQLTTEGKKGTVEYEQAVTDLTQAEEAAALAVTMHGEALEDQQRTYENFYMNIFTTAISSVGTLGTSLQALEAVGIPVLSKITNAVKGLSLSLKTLSIGGAVGLAITGLIMLTQNFLEARAASEALQKQIMELSQTSIDLAFTAIKNSDIQQKTDAINTLRKSIADLEAQPIERTFWDKFDSSGGKAWDLRNQQLGKMKNDLALLEKQVYELNTASTVLNATMNRQTWQFGQVNIQMLNYQDLIAKSIAQSKLQADASSLSAKAFEIYRTEFENGVFPALEKSNAQFLINNKLLGEQPDIVDEAAAAWEEYRKEINSFVNEILGMDKKDFKKKVKDIGFGDIAKDLEKQRKKKINVSDIFGDIFEGIKLTNIFKIKDEDFSSWLQDLNKRVEKAIEKNPESASLLRPFATASKNDKITQEEFAQAIQLILANAKNDPEIQKIADLLGIDLGAYIGAGAVPEVEKTLGEGFGKMDLSQYVKFDEGGKAKTVGNPLTGLITVMTKSLDQTVVYATGKFEEIGAYKVKVKNNPLDKLISTITKSFDQLYKYNIELMDGIAAYKVKVKNNPYAKYIENIIKSFDQMKDKVEKIMNSLPTELTIDVKFDVEKPPKITESGGKIDVKFAASGYQGWVRGGSGQMFMVAEHGEDEYVSITPKSKIRSQNGVVGGGSNGPIQITLN
ncbi:MAG: hypothetical protein CV087_10650, partial [Candidatus Brocadia sp. WS118]